MKHNIHVSTIACATSDSVLNESLSKLLASIREEIFFDKVSEIRNENDAARQKSLKQKLPLFYPAVLLNRQRRLDESSSATGVVQFDLDLGSNTEQAIQRVYKEIRQVRECIYAFLSPRGGLKFGILTDFMRNAGESDDAFIVRFKHAYSLALVYVQSQCKTWFEADECCQHIRQGCYVSCDPDAYYQGNCAVYQLNSRCIASDEAVESDIRNPQDEASVLLALQHIPKDLKYEGRMEVNYPVLYLLREQGISLLMAHWSKQEKGELRDQLQYMLKSVRFGSIAQLWSLARKYGYKPPTGKQRSKEKPIPIDMQLPPLSTPQEASDKIKEIVKDFLDHKNSHFINVTAGAGKTKTVLDALVSDLPKGKKVLFLTPTKKLSNEIRDKYTVIHDHRAENATGLRDKIGRKRVQILQGRSDLCENRELYNRYQGDGSAKISMPLEACLRDCLYKGQCRYTLQFDDVHATIRIMTHSEWKNVPSAWAGGTVSDGDGVAPRDKNFGWKPDYIVIDENVIAVGGPKAEGVVGRFPSIKCIIAGVQSGQSLRHAVDAAHHLIEEDSKNNFRDKSPKFTTTDEYIARKEQNKNVFFSEALEQLNQYCRYGDPAYLNGMWVKDNKLYWADVKLAHSRYSAVPTLFLDATANEMVVSRLLPTVQFHRIAVKSRPDVNLYQMYDATLTKKFLSDPAKLENVIVGLRNLTSRYKNVGLITYSRVGNNELFSSTLASRVGVSEVLHFGNQKGLDVLQDVDCLLIVGRHLLPQEALSTFARAIFDHGEQIEQTYANFPVRMKDGSVREMNGSIGSDDVYQAIHVHFCLSETLQAIGRGRPIFGSKKDIFVFANENLGTDIEVTDFFSFADYFIATEPERKNFVDADKIATVKARGYLQNKQGEIAETLELSLSVVKKHRDAIEEELLAAGMEKQSLMVQYKNRTKKEREYFVFGSTEQLKLALEEGGEKLLSA